MKKPLASLLSTPHSSTLKKKIFNNEFPAKDLGTKRMTAPRKIRPSSTNVHPPMNARLPCPQAGRFVPRPSQ
jgi:hypothetical protein